MIQEMINRMNIHSNVIKTKSLLIIMSEIEIDIIVKQRKILTPEELYTWYYLKMKIKEYNKRIIGCNQLKEQLRKWKEESVNNEYK